MTASIVSIGAQHWPYDDEEVTLKDAFRIKAASGLTLQGFMTGVQEMDPLALQTLIWFVRTKAGESVRLEDIDFKIVDLNLEQVQPPDADIEVDADPLAPTVDG